MCSLSLRAYEMCTCITGVPKAPEVRSGVGVKKLTLRDNIVETLDGSSTQLSNKAKLQ